MVREIMMWNQGWVRDSNHLIAGLGLVLFYDTNEQQGQKIVDNYLKQLVEE